MPTSSRTPSQSFCTVLLRVVDQAGKAIAQEQLSPVGLGLGQQRQQRVPHLSRNLFCPENLERLRKIENFGNGRRFFHAPAAQGLRESRHAGVKLGAGFWCS